MKKEISWFEVFLGYLAVSFIWGICGVIYEIAKMYGYTTILIRDFLLVFAFVISVPVWNYVVDKVN